MGKTIVRAAGKSKVNIAPFPPCIWVVNRLEIVSVGYIYWTTPKIYDIMLKFLITYDCQ